MAIHGSIGPHDLHDHAAAIKSKLGVVTYLRCWVDVMILHRQSIFLGAVFACLDAAA